MKLLIDIGNTRIKWAFDNGSDLVAAGEAVHRGQPAGFVAEVFSTLGTVPAHHSPLDGMDDILAGRKT